MTVIEAMPQLISREEPFAGELVRESLEQVGVDVYAGARAEAVSRDGDEIRVRLDDGEEVCGDLLVASGRKPLTSGLGLESVGLPGGGYVEVNDHMQVIGAPGMYAVGEVGGRSC